MFSKLLKTEFAQELIKSYNNPTELCYLLTTDLRKLLVTEIDGHWEFHHKYYVEIAYMLFISFFLMWFLFFYNLIYKSWTEARKSLRFALFIGFLFWMHISGIHVYFTYFHLVMLLGMVLLI